MSVNGEEKPTPEEEKHVEEEAHPPPPVEEVKPEVKEENKVATTEEKKVATTEEKKIETKVATTEEKSSPVQSKTSNAVENGEVNIATGDSASESSPANKTVGFKERFRQFSKFGDSKSDGKMITLSQSDKWMKQAKVIDKKITTTDTGIYFKKFKMQKIPLSDYEKFLEDLAKSKKVEVEEIKKKMIECGVPGLTGPSGGASKNSPSTVERLTDTSKYTGSHKQRFDETGKGKGISGRKDTPDKSGYVQGYQNKDSYNKTH